MLVTKSTVVALSLALAAGAGWTGTALAQSTGKDSSASESAPTFSNKELKSFALALVTVQDLNQMMLDKMSRAKTPEEETIVRSEAQQQMVQAVQEEGLSVAKYNSISMEVRTNPEMAEKVKQHMESAK
jgi:hypothetical protein